MARRNKNKRSADDDEDLGLGTSAGQTADHGKTRLVKVPRTVAPTTQSSRHIDDAIDTVLSQDVDESMDASDDVNQLTDTVTRLVQKVQDQKQTIDQLTKQVSFLLSYLGVDSVSSLVGTPPANITTGSSSSPAVGQQQQQPVNSYADVITARRPVASSSALKQAVVSAVYKDFEDKDRRNKSIVVHGLPPADNDTDAVNKVLVAEFDQTINKVKCRRLGRPQTGKIQPILVTLETYLQASYIIDSRQTTSSERPFSSTRT